MMVLLADLNCGVRFGRHRCVYFTQPVLVRFRVVAAEQEFSTGRKHNTCASPSTAPVAPVGSCQLWAGQCSGHDSSVLAFGVTRLPGAGPPRRYGAVRSLFQTYGGHVLFPSAFLCVVTNTKHKESCWQRLRGRLCVRSQLICRPHVVPLRSRGQADSGVREVADGCDG